MKGVLPMKSLKTSLIVVLLLLAQGIRTGLHADNAFFRVLAAKPNATMEDAVTAIYMLKVEESPAEKMTFATMCDILRQRKLIKTKYAKDPARLVNRGQMAYMICRAIGIKGGLTMRVFGVSERYGYRECVYLKLIPGDGTQADRISGSELLGILAQALEYQEGHQKK